MSGAPLGRMFSVTYNKGKEGERTADYTFEPLMTNDVTINRLRKLMIKRRSEARRAMIRDWRELGAGLDAAAQAAFAKEIVSQAAEDVELSAERIGEFMQSLDEEAVAVIIWSCVQEIDTLEDAKALVAAYGDTIGLLELAEEVSAAEIEAEKN